MENICIECKENRKILARGLCRTCYQRKRKNNEINTKNKEQIYLGTFKNLEEAIKIRNNFLRENDSLCYQLQE